MSNEIEYIEPTQEHVGQMVEVRDTEDVGWTEATLTGIVHDDFRFAAKRSGDRFSMCWRFARIARPLTYAERQAKCGLKVGDRVRIIRKYGEGEGGFEVIYSARDMDRMIGRVYPISQIRQDYGIQLNCFWFPYFVLEKVEDRVATFSDIGKQVYVEGTPSDVFTFEIIYGVEGDLWRAVIRSGDNRLVYELSNLRVKE